MPFTSEKQRRFMFAEHPRIAKRWAHENPEGDEGLPTYAHGESTSPALKKKWDRVKQKLKGQSEDKMKYNEKGVAMPGKVNPYAKKEKKASLKEQLLHKLMKKKDAAKEKKAGVNLRDLIKSAQSMGPQNVRPSKDAAVSCMTCKYFTPLSGNRSGPGMCNVGSRPVPVKGTDVSDDYQSKMG